MFAFIGDAGLYDLSGIDTEARISAAAIAGCRTRRATSAWLAVLQR